MGLLSRYLKAEVPTLNKNNIRLEYIGRQHELPADVQERMGWAREATSRNSGMVLTLALNYSARSELVDAFRSMRAMRLRRMVESIICRSMRTWFRSISTHGIFPIRIWWCGLPARCGSATSCCGNWPMRRYMSLQHCGPIFAEFTCSRELPNIRSASGATAA